MQILNPLFYLTTIGTLSCVNLLYVFSPPLSRVHAAELFVELELVLSADSSSSIHDDEFDLQIIGYANAFRD